MDLVKVYPSGRVTASVLRRFKPEPVKAGYELSVLQQIDCELLHAVGYERAREAIAALRPLGLSMPAKSEKMQVRGQKGITSRGRNRVMDAITLLEKTYGKDRLSFVTLTVPPKFLNRVVRVWSRAIDLMKRSLSNKLKASDLPIEIVGVYEIQKKRFDREGGVPLHAHLVMVGRKKKGTWFISPKSITKLWFRSCRTAVKSLGYNSLENENNNANGNTNTNANGNAYSNVNRNEIVSDWNIGEWNASTNVQRVRKSAARYLSKYVTKGATEVQEIIKEGNGNLLPRAWYILTQTLLDRVKKSIQVYSGCDANHMFEMLRDESDRYLRYQRFVTLDRGDGRQFCVGWYGYLTPQGVSVFN